jgi:hypothetical protein
MDRILRLMVDIHWRPACNGEACWQATRNMVSSGTEYVNVGNELNKGIQYVDILTVINIKTEGVCLEYCPFRKVQAGAFVAVCNQLQPQPHQRYSSLHPSKQFHLNNPPSTSIRCLLHKSTHLTSTQPKIFTFTNSVARSHSPSYHGTLCQHFPSLSLPGHLIALTGLVRRVRRPRLHQQVQRAEAGQEPSLDNLQDLRRLEGNCRRGNVGRPRLHHFPREAAQRKVQGPSRQ